MEHRAKRGACVFALCAALAALLAFSACAAPESLLEIDGKKISEREYTAAMEQNVAGTVRYFQTAYGCTYTAGFWQSSIEGESPATYLQQAAVEDLVHHAVQERLLRQADLWPFACYEDFLEQWEAENARRTQAVKAGEVIYGPVTYGEREYYEYLLANGVTRLKQEYVRQSRIEPSPQALKTFFNEHPELVSQPYDTIRLDLLCYSYVGPDGAVHAGAQQQALEAAQAGLGLLETVPMEEMPERQQQASFTQMKYTNGTARSDSLLMPQVFAWAQQADVGQRSGILQDNGAYWIARVTGREAAPAVRFEDVRDYISAKYVDACFEEILQQATDSAQVKLLTESLPLPKQ